MIRLFALGSFAILLGACAAERPVPGNDPMHESRGSTEAGVAKAAALGFHGPMRRSGEMDGPN